jgi:fumarate hydratase class II
MNVNEVVANRAQVLKVCLQPWRRRAFIEDDVNKSHHQTIPLECIAARSLQSWGSKVKKLRYTSCQSYRFKT